MTGTRWWLSRVQIASRDRAVARERVNHARRAGQARHAAEQLADVRDDQDDLPRSSVSALSKTAERAAAPSLIASTSVAANVIASSTIQPMTPSRRPTARRPWRRLGRAVRLLGDVRRGVEAGDRVLRQQEAERQHVEPEHALAEARVVDRLGEDEVDARVVVGHEDEDRDDHRDADHVPPDRDGVEQRDQGRRADVDQHVQREDQREQDERRRRAKCAVGEVDDARSTLVQASGALR